MFDGHSLSHSPPRLRQTTLVQDHKGSRKVGQLQMPRDLLGVKLPAINGVENHQKYIEIQGILPSGKLT